MRQIFIILVVISLVGCGSPTAFNRAMEKPAASAKNSADVAKAAEQDILRARALGVYKPAREIPFPVILCHPSAGASATGMHLMAFADALETVNKVAQKPNDTSYAAYIRKFAENDAAITRDFAAERKQAEDQIKAARARCVTLATADAKGELTDLDEPGVGVAAVPAAVGSILALDQLVKVVLAQLEKAQRDAAVKATIKHLVPQLREAANKLKTDPGADFGVVVQYQSGTSEEAVNMNGTVLGAVISIRRWSVAARARADWEALGACRKEPPHTSCMGRHMEAMLANSLIDNVYAYRALANIDPQKLLAQLDKAIEGAETATRGDSLAGLLDALIGIGDALSGISDKYEAYRKTRD